jgi:hypothetical protein
MDDINITLELCVHEEKIARFNSPAYSLEQVKASEKCMIREK